MTRMKRWGLLCLGSAILAFGLYEVHAQAGVTEGGLLGLELLLHYWFGLSPAVTSAVLGTMCYLIGFAILGTGFIGDSIVATASYSIVYALLERTPPVWKNIADDPLAAAVVGALFVGVGVGICVRQGGAPSGDDALAMALSKVTHLPIQWVYLAGDLAVLGLSLTYLPAKKIACSLLTVFLSGQIIGWIERFGRTSPPPKNDCPAENCN